MSATAALDRKSLLRWILQGVALGGVATVAVFLFTVRADTWEHLRGLNLWWLPFLVLPVGLAWTANGARVWILCRALGHNLSFGHAFRLSLCQDFGVAATPAGIGGALLRLTLLRRAGVPVAHGGSMFATDTAIDLLFFALLTPVALWILLHDSAFGGLLARVNAPALLPWLLAALAVLVAGAAALRSAAAHRLIERIAGATAFGRRRRIPARHRFVRIAVSRTLRRMRGALSLLWHRRRSALLLSFLFASIQWTCRYSLLPLVLCALGVRVNPLPLFLAQGLLLMLTVFVVAPGGGGAIEVLTALILPAFLPVALVGPAVLLWRLFSYHLYLIGGGTAFFLSLRADAKGRIPVAAGPAQK